MTKKNHLNFPRTLKWAIGEASQVQVMEKANRSSNFVQAEAHHDILYFPLNPEQLVTFAPMVAFLKEHFHQDKIMDREGKESKPQPWVSARPSSRRSLSRRRTFNGFLVSHLVCLVYLVYDHLLAQALIRIVWEASTNKFPQIWVTLGHSLATTDILARLFLVTYPKYKYENNSSTYASIKVYVLVSFSMW